MTPLSRDAFAGADQRFDRFAWAFKEIDVLIDTLNQTTVEYRGTHLRLSAGDGKQVSMLFVMSFGKAMKTFQAVTYMAVLGFGEDAGILLRSNVDLLINLAYLLSASDTASRVSLARDFIAYSFTQHEKLMRLGFDEAPKMRRPFVDAELIERAKRWNRTKLAVRAIRADQAGILPKSYYDKQYRFFSSFEHSDANALIQYLERHDEEGAFISADPDDDLVDLMLVDNFDVMARVEELRCRYFSIDRPDLRAKVREARQRLEAKQ